MQRVDQDRNERAKALLGMMLARAQRSDTHKRIGMVKVISVSLPETSTPTRETCELGE